MAPNAESTRHQLIDAAEALFAARGIDSVSLREINAAAGQRNCTALQYHFTNRIGLLTAVLQRHQVAVEDARHALLDAYETRGRDEPRALAGALVRPSAATLADASGRAYLQIHAQIVNHADFRNPLNPRDSLYRWRQLVGPLLSDVAERRLNHRFTAIRLTAVELARRAGAAPRRDDGLFTSHLVDLVTAVLDAPVSVETARLLADHAATARPRRIVAS
jgi:AcrR family transcriptional regulator